MPSVAETTSEVMDVIGDKITAIADKLQVPAEQLLEIGISGQIAEGVTTISIGGLIAFIVIAAMILVCRFINKNKEDFSTGDRQVGILTTMIVGFILLLIILLITFVSVAPDVSPIVKIFAPEYSLLKMLIN